MVEKCSWNILPLSAVKLRPPWACQSWYYHLSPPAHLWNVPNNMFKTHKTKISSWWIKLKILCLSICHIMVDFCLTQHHKLGTLVSVVCLNLSDYTFWNRPLWHFNSFTTTLLTDAVYCFRLCHGHNRLTQHAWKSPSLSDIKIYLRNTTRK